MEQKPRIISTVINDVIYDQRMIRICTSLSKNFEVSLWGRVKTNHNILDRPFEQKRFKFLINKGPLFYFLYNLRIFCKLLYSRFDIVHSVDLDTLPAGYFASKLKGKKLVYDSHEYFTEVPELLNRPKVRNFWINIENYILPKLKNAMTVGEMIAKEYEAKYGVNFSVIKNAPVFKHSTNQTSYNASYLIYQGALNKGRGLESLIEAMKFINIKLKIAGTGDIEMELKQKVLDLKLDHKVEFLGLLEPQDLPQLTQDAFLGINVSENLGLSYYYSLNNKFFDYIHAGLPAITNKFPEYQNLDEKYRCCEFADCNPKSIAKAVNLLINDSSKYALLKKNCFLAKEELNWNCEEEKLLEFYANIT